MSPVFFGARPGRAVSGDFMNRFLPPALVLLAALGIAPALRAETPLALPGPVATQTMQRLLLIDAARAGDRIVAVGDHGSIVYSSDNGKSWSRAKVPAAPMLTAVDFVDAKKGWAVGHDSLILATVDGGETWVEQFSAPKEQRPLFDVLFLDANTGFAVGAYGAFYETSDGGKTWTARKVIEEDKHLNAIVKTGDGQLLILGEAGEILHSADSGKSWKPIVSPYKGSLFGAVLAKDGAVVAFGMRGRIFRSVDGGKNWKAVDNPSTTTLMGATALPDGKLVISGGSGKLLLSGDNGLTFAPIPSGSIKAFAKPIAGAPGALLLLGETGAREIPLPAAGK
jgi:photosystem II stability/assembly factor-like uncharacterized protein